MLQVRLPNFYPGRGAPSPSDPSRPALRRGRVCNGNERIMPQGFRAGISLLLCRVRAPWRAKNTSPCHQRKARRERPRPA